MKVEHSTDIVVVDLGQQEPVAVPGLRVVDDNTIEVPASIVDALGGSVSVSVVRQESIEERLRRLTQLARRTWPRCTVVAEECQLRVKTPLALEGPNGGWGEPGWYVHLVIDGDDEVDLDSLECALFVQSQR